MKTSKLPGEQTPPSGLSRREFMRNTGLLACSAAATTMAPLARAEEHQHQPAAGVAAVPFKFGAEPHRVRKNFHDLTDDEVKQLCAAISYMRHGSRSKPLSMDNPLQWDRFAVMHEQHCTEAGYDQVHWSWFFLPWHRGYLFFLERILANILTTIYGVDGSKFALPYWDWTAQKGIPNTADRESRGLASPFFGYDLTRESMVEDDGLVLNGKSFDNQALWEGNRTPTIARPEMNPQYEKSAASRDHIAETVSYMSVEYIKLMLRLPFADFAGAEKIDAANGQGVLEQNPHNNGHDWVGSRYGRNRNMGTLRYAALDPIFFLHHANIDRIWSLYRLPQPDPDTSPWGAQIYTFLDVDGSPVTVSVKDIVKSMTTFEYSAGSASPPPQLVEAASKPAPAPAEQSEVIVSSPATLTAGPLVLESERKPAAHSLLIEGMNVGKGGISLLEITTGPIPFTGKFLIRVFINAPDANARTSTRDPHYLGRIAGLDSEARRGETDSEITHTFQIILGESSGPFYKMARADESYKLTLVPAGMPPEANFKIQIKRIRLRVLRDAK